MLLPESSCPESSRGYRIMVLCRFLTQIMLYSTCALHVKGTAFLMRAHTAGCMHLRYSETVPPSAPMRGGAVAVARLRSGVMPGPASFISFVLFYGCR